jgi:hypothetical protein
MTIDKGILNSNPFIQDSWINQGYGFTIHRQEQISKLFGKHKLFILGTNPKNENCYVAFVSIRWGFANIKDNKLTPTEKWFNRYLYDGHGRLLK